MGRRGWVRAQRIVSGHPFSKLAAWGTGGHCHAPSGGVAGIFTPNHPYISIQTYAMDSSWEGPGWPQEQPVLDPFCGEVAVCEPRLQPLRCGPLSHQTPPTNRFKAKINKNLETAPAGHWSPSIGPFWVHSPVCLHWFHMDAASPDSWSHDILVSPLFIGCFPPT